MEQERSHRLPEGADAAQNAQARGQLKIFFGYASGVGKTHTMLKAAYEAKKKGMDVAVGYVNTKARPQMAALLKGLEIIPPAQPFAKQEELPAADPASGRELDTDAVIARHPQIVLVDELAHTNAAGCRHTSRYQDVEEIVKAGIDVYTTVNVWDIESLNDMVCAITGVTVRERIPDSVFDGAAQVKLVDMEPQELMERLHSGKEYQADYINGAFAASFTLEKLTALRELALRRGADRVNYLTAAAGMKKDGRYYTEEHILVCLSSAPSNAKIIRMAARMAAAFRGVFTALFVETPQFASMEEENKNRLRTNMRLAQQLGAAVETVYGDDVSFQIAEFARLSGVTKVVIGRSTAARRYFWAKPTLTDKLIAMAPNLDIHIIPDFSTKRGYDAGHLFDRSRFVLSFRDTFRSIGILLLATLIGFLFSRFGFTEANIITVYILGVLVISVVTTHRAYSLISSIVSVLIFNFFFTVPRYTFLAYEQGYPVTFLVMFLAAFLTGTLAGKLKNHAKQAAQAAYRTKVLFETNQILQQAEGKSAIVTATAGQLTKLVGRDVVIYPAENGALQEPSIFPTQEQSSDLQRISVEEKEVADWVLKNNKHAGATTDTFSNAKCLYYAIRVNSKVYGVVGIVIGDGALDVFENSVLLSILGECALALENEKNRQEKEEAAVLAQKEQLRANLLRAISHDLRTPLTSISGNASNLLSNGIEFDEGTRKRIYTDIYDDSMWLINLVENLLSVTRIEDGRMSLHIATELMDEVITEALQHVNRRRTEHQIKVESSQEFILAKMDARLIVQVLINIVDNAIKYTPQGSQITIRTRQEAGEAIVEIADDGPGIPDEIKKHVFDMFYSGANQIADSRRSLGLGLALCKAIVTAHGGSITVGDNLPRGAVFTFTLPAEEVALHE